MKNIFLLLFQVSNVYEFNVKIVFLHPFFSHFTELWHSICATNGGRPKIVFFLMPIWKWNSWEYCFIRFSFSFLQCTVHCIRNIRKTKGCRRGWKKHWKQRPKRMQSFSFCLYFECNLVSVFFSFVFVLCNGFLLLRLCRANTMIIAEHFVYETV